MPPKHISDLRKILVSKHLFEVENQHPNVEVKFPNPENFSEFHVTIIPTSGIWKNGKFVFGFMITTEWPCEPPHVRLFTKIWHPLISKDGRLELPIFYHYSPAVTISQILDELQTLLTEPYISNYSLNYEANEQFHKNFPAFKLKAQEYIDQFCPK